MSGKVRQGNASSSTKSHNALTDRILQFAERYATPLPQLTDEVAALAAEVDAHLAKMGHINVY
jgi:hypothetical protein